VANRHAIEEYLLTRQVDLAIISLIDHPDHFIVEPFMPYELVMVASPSHPLAKHVSLPPHALRGETFLLREQGAGTRMDTEWHFAHAGIPLETSQELASIEAIKEGVIAELGIAVLSYESVALEVTHGDLVVLDVQGFPLQRQWHLVHLKGRDLSLPAAALRQFLLQNV
jgi:DNA-binding transcriptional LysR family regulator